MNKKQVNETEAIEEQEAAQSAADTPEAPAFDANKAEQEWIGKIRQAQENADRLDMIRAAAEAEAKRAKKNHEAAVDSIQELIRSGPTTQMELPFTDTPGASSAEQAWNQMLAGTTVEDAIELKPKQLERLQEAGVKTMLDLENLRAGKLQDYPRGLLSVKGFGEAAVDTIEAAIMQWIETNQPIETEPEAEAELATA